MDGPPADGRARTRWPLIALAATGVLVLVGGLAALVTLRADDSPAAVTVTSSAPSDSPHGAAVASRTAPPPPAASSAPQATSSATASPPSNSTPSGSPGALAPSPAGPTSTPTAVAATTPPTTAATVVASNAATPAPSLTPPPSSSLPAGPGEAPFVLAPGAAGVGETFIVRVFAASAATVTVELAGKTYSLNASTDRFWGVVGVPLETEPGRRTLRVTARAASGAIQGTAETPLLVAAVQRPIDYLELTEEQSSVLTEDAAAIELSIRANQFSSFDSGKRWVGRFAIPLVGPQTTAFGQGRSINGGPVGGFHSGMDIGADAGTLVHASAGGRVASVIRMPIRGLSVVIDHGAGVKSGYHHMEATLVAEGDIVAIGQPIGRVGSTGLSTGPHLHWEVLVWGINVDPLQWTAESFEP